MDHEKITIEIPEDILKNWQEIVNILAEMLEIPAALIMRYVDPSIEVFLASNSEGNPYHPGDKETVFGSGLYCERVLTTKDKLLVPDALADKHWKNNPDIKLDMISYLGFPILLPSKEPFGTICVLDTKPNHYSETTEKLILKFRTILESQLEMIYVNQILGDKNKRLTDYLMELQALRGLVPICASCKSIRDSQNNWHPIEEYLIRHPEAEFSHGICPECMKKLYPNLAISRK
ncbi:MAG: GAF domain-containing protein [Desulfurivibrionaceae bacterium]